MYMQALVIRGAAAVLFGLAAVVGVAQQHRSQAPAQPAPVTAPHANTSVAASAPIVTLPTISVRPTAQEYVDAMHESDLGETTLVAYHASAPTLHPASMQTLHLDVPFYSFGKVLPRVSKEMK